ncbi:MAG: histidine phosphatase family protein, partial [Nannocystaceae bacterium]
MSKLLIIRHGQASFGAADYDQLSPLGYQQSRNLGAWAARFGLPISHLVIGPRLRHRQTAEAMLEGMGSAAPLTAKDVSPAPIWDEFPAFEVIAHGLPRLIKTLPPEMARAYSEAALDPKGQRETFEKMFRHTIRAWVVGELDVPECETYADFHQRIRTAIHNLMAEHGRGQTIVVVTSAGPVAAAARTALELPPWPGMKLSLVIANSALVELRYRDTELTLT